MIPKFRVYDEKSKLMRGVAYMDFLKKEITYYIEDDIFYEQFDRKFDEVVLMQSTGLKDKNGVEIFEGDIVRTYGNDYTPIYSKGIYMALNVSQIKLPKENWFFSTQFNIVWRDGCEVIGNIYEDKELLR